MEFFRQADPERAALALALAFDKSVLKQLLDVVVSATATQVHELRLQDAFFQRHGGQGPQACGAQVHRHQLLNQSRQVLAQLQAVAGAFLADFQGRIAVGVVSHQGDQRELHLIALTAGQLAQFRQAQAAPFEVEDRLELGRKGELG